MLLNFAKNNICVYTFLVKISIFDLNDEKSAERKINRKNYKNGGCLLYKNITILSKTEVIKSQSDKGNRLSFLLENCARSCHSCMLLCRLISWTCAFPCKTVEPSVFSPCSWMPFLLLQCQWSLEISPAIFLVVLFFLLHWSFDFMLCPPR